MTNLIDRQYVYELPEKPKRDGRKPKGHTTVKWALLGPFLVLFIGGWVAIALGSDLADWVFLMVQMMNFLIILMVVYALWRSRLITDHWTRVAWILAILTGIGAVVFLLVEPEGE